MKVFNIGGFIDEWIKKTEDLQFLRVGYLDLAKTKTHDIPQRRIGNQESDIRKPPQIRKWESRWKISFYTRKKNNIYYAVIRDCCAHSSYVKKHSQHANLSVKDAAADCYILYDNHNVWFTVSIFFRQTNLRLFDCVAWKKFRE